MERRLYRSRKNKVISGVCGGIAEYMNVDPTIVRLIWAISIVYGGIGIIAYIICLIVIPEATDEKRQNDSADAQQQYDKNEQSCPEDQYSSQQDQSSSQHQNTSDRNRIVAGTLLICIGGFMLFRRYFYWINLGKYWPVLLIVAGIVIIVNGTMNRGESQ